MIRALLKPHSRKWFGALANSNVWQAAMALQNVQWARSKRVCSCCGKKPARDYQFPHKALDKVQPITMRLCKVCYQARQQADSGHLVPLVA